MPTRPRPPALDPPEQIFAALLAGELSAADLTARELGAFLGKTTGHVYHRWGSLDGLLFAVSQAGFAHLGRELGRVYERTNGLAEVAAAFVEFGLAHPDLYTLMFEHRFDWDALRARGMLTGDTPGLGLWRMLAEQLGAEEARLLFAGLHGLVSLAASGRANIGLTSKSDREVARASARRLVHMLCPSANNEENHDEHHHAAHARQAGASEPSREERDERAARGKRRRAQ
jgi:AcrR family transcriptional regulator